MIVHCALKDVHLSIWEKRFVVLDVPLLMVLNVTVELLIRLWGL